MQLLTTPKPDDGDFGGQLSDFLGRTRGKQHSLPEV